MQVQSGRQAGPTAPNDNEHSGALNNVDDSVASVAADKLHGAIDGLLDGLNMVIPAIAVTAVGGGDPQDVIDGVRGLGGGGNALAEGYADVLQGTSDAITAVRKYLADPRAALGLDGEREGGATGSWD